MTLAIIAFILIANALFILCACILAGREDAAHKAFLRGEHE